MLDAGRYLVDNGIKWRAMPGDFPPWDRVYAFFQQSDNRWHPRPPGSDRTTIHHSHTDVIPISDQRKRRRQTRKDNSL
jgi:transposase